MGHAKNLFFSSNPDNQTLHRRITPTDEQYDEQLERWNELADYLLPKLKEMSGLGTRTWLQGSYKFGTQIRPVRLAEEFDIDLGFYFEWPGSEDDGDHGPGELKKFVRQALQSYSAENETVLEVAASKPRCERIRYQNHFHIDVPTYHLNEEERRSLATQDDEWEISDPKAIYVWFKDCFEDAARAGVRRIIRYLKAWAALKFPKVEARPSSILLTVLVAEAAAVLGPDNLGSDDESFAAIVSTVSSRISNEQSVPNPANDDENLASRLDEAQWKKFAEQLSELEGQCARALDAEDELSAAYIWQEAFDYLFPTPASQEAVLAEKSNLPAPLFTPEVTVFARSLNNPNVTYSDQNRIGPIPKDCKITFTLSNPNRLPLGASVNWTVRNEGREAENINDLGHRAEAGLVAVETSSYRGRHFMDCTIRQHGRVIAMRRVPVEIAGTEVPRRNPKSRPAWTKFRR